jgi:hypothetical protein
VLLRDRDGAVRAGACLQRLGGGRLRAAANGHSGDWDAVAAGEPAPRALW